VTSAYPADGARDAAFPTRARGDMDRTYRTALRHSRRVRLLRVTVLAGIATLLLAVVAANYMPSIGEFRLPGELGKLVIKGTTITMQQPKLTGYTSDARAYEFTANAAAQDITNPDIVELQQLHAKMEMADKSTAEMTAPTGTYDMKANTLTLNDDIVLASSSGYSARMTQAVVDMHTGNVVSDQPVSVKLINGVLNAKRMEVSDHDTVIRFDGGVAMTLQPDKTPDKANTP
jgi:lipopolysaccharide export system protein LptC